MKILAFIRPGKQTVFSFFLFITASILLISCQKSDQGGIDNSEIAEAKSWFASNVLAGESQMLAKPFSQLPKMAPWRLLARMNKLSKKLDWSKAITGSADRLEYVLVPLWKDDLSLKNNYFVKRVFVFYKYNNAPIQMQVVELLTKNQPAANPVRLASSLFERKVAAERLPAQVQDVQVFFYDKDYNTLDAYTINNNSWKVLQGSCLNQKKAGQLATESGTGECELWGVFLIYYDENGNEIDRELLYTYWKGDCGGENSPPGDHPYEEQPEEPGGGGEEDGNETFRTLTWHVYNTSGGPLNQIGAGNGVNSIENVRGKRSSAYPAGGYFKSANHYTSTCNSGCDNDTGGTYGETSASVTYTPDQVSSTVTGRYPENGASKPVGGSKTWTFNQVF